MPNLPAPQSLLRISTITRLITVFCCVLCIGLIWVFGSPMMNEPNASVIPELPINESSTALDRGRQSMVAPSKGIEKRSAGKTKSLYRAVRDKAFLSQLKTPYGFSIDPFYNRLIWTSSEESTFKLADPDGTDVTVIQTNFEEPYLLKIDNSFGHTSFFYAEGNLIRREVDTQLGKVSDSILLNLGEQKIHGLGFDESTDTLFLGDQYGQPASVISLANDAAVVMKYTTPITLTTPED